MGGLAENYEALVEVADKISPVEVNPENNNFHNMVSRNDNHIFF